MVLYLQGTAFAVSYSILLYLVALLLFYILHIVIWASMEGWAWELDPTFRPHQAKVRASLSYVNVNGQGMAYRLPAAGEEAIKSPELADIEQLPFPDPGAFLAGGIQRCASQWEAILEGDMKPRLLAWVREGVDVAQFMQPFCGEFDGVAYDSPLPPPRVARNARCCQGHVQFIQDTIMEKLRSGAISLWGKRRPVLSAPC